MNHKAFLRNDETAKIIQLNNLNEEKTTVEIGKSLPRDHHMIKKFVSNPLVCSTCADKKMCGCLSLDKEKFI